MTSWCESTYRKSYFMYTYELTFKFPFMNQLHRFTDKQKYLHWNNYIQLRHSRFDRYAVASLLMSTVNIYHSSWEVRNLRKTWNNFVGIKFNFVSIKFILLTILPTTSPLQILSEIISIIIFDTSLDVTISHCLQLIGGIMLQMMGK